MPTEELELIANCIRVAINLTVYRYAKANGKYMKDYDLNTVSWYLMYWDFNNLYGWIKMYLWMVSSANVRSLDSLRNSYKTRMMIDTSWRLMLVILDVSRRYFRSLPERMKIEKCQIFVCNTCDKKSCVMHIIALKMALDYRLILEKVHRVI